MDRIDTMQIFLRVADLASFTQAALALGRPKASVSTAVQQLEGALGTRLFHRTTRRVELTQDGRAYYERCKALLGELEATESMFRGGDEALSGRLRVDMPLVTGADVVIPRLPEFLAKHPALELEVSATDRRVDVVREGFDCVLRVGTLADSSLIARPLGRMRMTNCASPAYVAKRGLPRSLADLSRHVLVGYAGSPGSRPDGFEYVDARGTHEVAMKVAVTVNNAVTYRAACLAGFGIVQVPAAGVTELLRRGELVEVLPRHRAAPMPVSLVYANRRNLPRKLQVFMAWLTEVMRPYAEQ